MDCKKCGVELNEENLCCDGNCKVCCDCSGGCGCADEECGCGK